MTSLSDNGFPFDFEFDFTPKPPKQKRVSYTEIERWERQTASRRDADRRRRAAKHGVDSERYTEADVLERWGTCCHLCGEEVDLDAPRLIGKLGWERGLHLEHVVDLALGGADVVENVKPSHGLCNLEKRPFGRTI